MNVFLGIDIGTTNCKIAACDDKHRITAVRSFPTPKHTHDDGNCLYDASKLWQSIKKNLEELITFLRPCSIGITSMAEAGVLIDRHNGKAVSDIIPWYDKRSVSYFNAVQTPEFEREGFFRTGLHNAYKYSLYKLLMMKKEYQADLDNIIWLSAAAYIAYCLTGCFGEDHTLALRTYCYDLPSCSYDTEFMRSAGLSPNVYAPVSASGKPVGSLRSDLVNQFGLEEAVPVSVCGHDHLCAAVATGALSEDDILLSLGTTAVVLGNFAERPLNNEDFQSGLSFGRHTLPGRMTWMGTIQSAGSAIDWSRLVTNLDGDCFDNVFSLLEQKKEEVTGILFFPYLSGSGAPMLDISARGSWIGLDAETDRGSLVKSVLEGISYEVRMILEKAGNTGDITIRAAGGGSQNPYLMQVLSDVTGRRVIASDCGQETAAGAALIAAGVFSPLNGTNEKVYRPGETRNKIYTGIYENGYKKLQQPLRSYFKEEFERKQNR